MDLVKFLKVLGRRKWVLIIVPILTSTVVYLLVRNSPRTFKSKAKIATGITEQTNSVSIEDKESVQPFVINNQFGNLMVMFKGQALARRVGYLMLERDLNSPEPYRMLKRKDSLNRPATISRVKEALKTKLGYEFGRKLTPEDEELVIKFLEAFRYHEESFKKNLKIERTPDSDYLNVEFESENPELSAVIANMFCKEFVNMYKGSQAVQSETTLDYFKRLADEKRADLDKKVDQLKQFKLNHHIINLYEQTKSLVEQIKGTEIRLDEERKKIPGLITAIAEIDKKFTPNQRKLLEDQAGSFNRRVVDYKGKINSLNERYIKSGFRNQVIKDSINMLRAQFEKKIVPEMDGFLLNPGNTKQDLVNKKIQMELDLAISKAAVGNIERELDRLHTIVEEYTPLEASISAIEREIAVASDVYLLVLNKQNMAQFNALKAGESLRIIEIAVPSERPEPSKNLLLVIMAGAVSLVLCIVVIFLLEYLDQTSKSPSTFERQTRMVLLGTLNMLQAPRLDLKTLFSNKLVEADLEVFKQLMRDLRTRILKVTKGSKVIMFVGASHSEGKTLLISSLAYSLHMIGKKVLMIDANFRNNGLTRQFGVKPTLGYGLTIDSIDDLVKNTQVPGIDMIGNINGDYSPAEVLARSNFGAYMEELRDRYDYILVESSSLGLHSDAKEMDDMVDKVVAVFGANDAITTADKERLRYFEGLGQKFAGAILNKVEPDFMDEVIGQAPAQEGWLKSLFKKLSFKALKRSLSPAKLDYQ